jgi:hypothetical protein
MIALSSLVLASPAVLAASDTPPSSTSSPAPVSGNCGMQLGGTAVFCETFDNKNPGIPSRTGDLDPNVWGVSRIIGDGVNFGQHWYNQWNSTTIKKCDGTTPTVNAPNDVIICNGQLREAVNDNNSGQAGTVVALAMYPKQPFDFAGRTGTVSFDVSNDTTGTHGAWPEFWISDLPVPAPFSHEDSWQTLPANGLVVRLGNEAPVGQGGLCQNGNNLDKVRWNVDSVGVVRNYVLEDRTYNMTDVGTPSNPPLTLTLLDCVIAANGPGQMNHVEIRVSQSKIDVYATDAGVAATPTTLKHIASITNANLTLTRGLVWIEDVHYNAMKGDPARPSEGQHTFAWDNVAFDGPFTYRDFSYDALDSNTPGVNGAMNLGKFSLPNQTASWNVLNVPANPKGTAARVLFNFNNEVNPVPTVLNVIVNGHAHPTPWPYPDKIQYTWRTFAVTIPITDLVPGTNVVQLGSDQPMVSSNANIVLVDVPGGVPVLPGSNNAYPASGGSVGGNSGGATAPPTVAISASPTSMTSGNISTMTWSSTNATSCTASGN